MTPGNHDEYNFFLEIEIVTTKTVNSKSLKKICRRLLSATNVLKEKIIEVSLCKSLHSESAALQSIKLR